jgi:serine/threonine protein kinase
MAVIPSHIKGVDIKVNLQSLSLRSSSIASGAYAKVYRDRYKIGQVIKILNDTIDRQAVIRDVGYAAWFIKNSISMDYVVKHTEIIQDGRARKWGIGMVNGGNDLYSLLSNRKHGRYPQVKSDDFLTVSYQAITHVFRMHKEAGMIHRDLKPANILWNTRTKKLVLLDFNLAISLLKTGAGRDIRVQTRWYRAPEVILGDVNYTSKIDVWSLGLILLHLWTNHAVRASSAIEQLFHFFSLGGTPPPRTHLTQLPMWETLTSVDSGRWFPIFVSKKREDGFRTTDKLEKILEAVPSLPIRTLLRSMLQVDPAHRCTTEELVNSPSFRSAFLSLGSPSFGSYDLTSRPYSFSPPDPDLSPLLVEALEEVNYRDISPSVWFGFSIGLFELSTKLSRPTFQRWVKTRHRLYALHFLYWSILEDNVPSLYDAVEFYSSSRSMVLAALPEVISALPLFYSYYLSHPYTVALHLLIQTRGETWWNEQSKKKEMSEVTRLVIRETLIFAKGKPSRLTQTDYSSHIVVLLETPSEFS